MPNTKPVVDNPDVVNYVHNKAKTVGLVNVMQVGAVTKGQMGKRTLQISREWQKQGYVPSARTENLL